MTHQDHYDRHVALRNKIKRSPRKFLGKSLELKFFNEQHYDENTIIYTTITSIIVQEFNVLIQVHPLDLEKTGKFSLIILHSDTTCYLCNKSSGGNSYAVLVFA